MITNEVIKQLEKTYEMKSNNFEIYYNYFNNQKENNQLTLDEKVLLCGYLLDIDVTLSRRRYHGYPGKKMQLLEYFTNNLQKVNDETLELINDHVEKHTLYNKEKKEKEIKANYPDVYNELIELRKEKQNKQKTYKK